jgi:hypothetical protein
MKMSVVIGRNALDPFIAGIKLQKNLVYDIYYSK